MKASEIYSLYLKPAHLPADGSKREATIEKVALETLHPRPGQESKSIVLTFTGKAHKLILNQTNANRLVLIAGDDTDAWKGLVVNLSKGKYGQKDTVVIEPATNGKK